MNLTRRGFLGGLLAVATAGLLPNYSLPARVITPEWVALDTQMLNQIFLKSYMPGLVENMFRPSPLFEALVKGHKRVNGGAQIRLPLQWKEKE